MMYGLMGVGKSYIMFGVVYEKGVVYYVLFQFMIYEVFDGGDDFFDKSIEVWVIVWEIYNEEIYDLLVSVSVLKLGFGILFKMSGSSSGWVCEIFLMCIKEYVSFRVKLRKFCYFLVWNC